MTEHAQNVVPIAAVPAIDEVNVGNDPEQDRFLDGLVSALNLQQTEFPPIRWAVPGYLPEGATLLAGRPKSGKSWMALDIALGVAYGGSVFGSVEVDQGDVLYLALEDNARRLQSRIEQLLKGKTAPERCVFQMQWPRLAAGGLGLIERWLDRVRHPRLVVIDTLHHVREATRSMQDRYASDYEAVTPLQRLAGDRNIAMLIVHHVRKGEASDPLEMVSGSFGLTGGTDAVLVINRDSQGTTLYGRGRDLHEFERAMSFDKMTGLWGVLGDADEVRRSDERNLVIEALIEDGSTMGPKDIAIATGMTEVNVRQMLGRMVIATEIEKVGRGQYRAI